MPGQDYGPLPSRLYGPRHWPVWLAVGLLRLLATFSYATLVKLSGALGALVYRLPLPQRRVARRNLALCLPELTEAERERVLRAHFRSVGMTLCETALAWWTPGDRMLALAQIEGLEHIDRARAAGRGVILLVAHFTTLEMQAAFVAYSRPLHIVYKPSKDELVDAMMLRRRGRAAAGMISSHSIRDMIKALKRGEIVWYSPDQAYRGKGAEMVPFFGVPAATNVSTSRLARLTGAVVLPYFPERLPGAAGYRVRIGAPLEGIPSDDAVADTLRFTQMVEAHVRRIPEQYLWLHKRFKGLSSDYPDVYGSRPLDRAAVIAAASASVATRPAADPVGAGAGTSLGEGTGSSAGTGSGGERGPHST